MVEPIERTVIKVLRAFSPGDVVFIEPDHDLSREQLERVKAALDCSFETTGVRIVILPHGMRIAAREEERSECRLTPAG